MILDSWSSTYCSVPLQFEPGMTVVGKLGNDNGGEILRYAQNDNIMLRMTTAVRFFAMLRMTTLYSG